MLGQIVCFLSMVPRTFKEFEKIAHSLFVVYPQIHAVHQHIHPGEAASRREFTK